MSLMKTLMYALKYGCFSETLSCVCVHMCYGFVLSQLEKELAACLSNTRYNGNEAEWGFHAHLLSQEI